MSDNDLDELIDMLKALKRDHRVCEDCWYSCPLSEDGCCDHDQPEECNCGALAHNQRVDEVIAFVRVQFAWMDGIVEGMRKRLSVYERD